MNSSNLRVALMLLAFVFPIAAQTEGNEQAPKIFIVKDFLGKDRIINDLDGDGWDDLWCALFPDIKHRNKTRDTDGDGLTDYEEMVMWRDPFVEGPLPHEPTPEEIAEAERLAALNKERLQQKLQEEWPARQAELAKTLRPVFEAGQDKPDPEEIRHDNAALRARLTARRDEARAKQHLLAAQLDAIAARHGINRRMAAGTLVGESDAGPIFMSPQDAVAARTSFAVHLWPYGLYPAWQNASLSRNLTGAGVRASIWEANEVGGVAGILTNHLEFNSGRAVQVDGASPSHHATAVASVMAGGGILDVFQGSTNRGKLLRGIAYAGELRGHNLTDFVDETSDAVLDGQSFSNHSYGTGSGWQEQFIDGDWWWVWRSPAFWEDPRLGMYSPPTASGLSSADLDEFVVIAETHLPVFAAGNANNVGPGTAVRYKLPDGTVSTADRDWINGDDNYDTVIAPATAKNVLTVGSITDINFSSGNFGISGFSGMGPTDDGRIKPDLVAVGQRNATLGLEDSLFAAHRANTATYYNGVTPDSNNLTDLQGTSFAAPAVTGGLMLAEERRKQLFPGAAPLLASTWRAAAIHTALNFGAPGPKYFTGWGIFDAENLVALLEEDAALGRGTLIKEFTVSTGVPKTFYVILPANATGELTLAWSDPAGNPPAFGTVVDDPTPMLVNNLDIVVTDTATLDDHLPWVLNPDLAGKNAAVRGAPATRGTDDRNNVEKVTIDPVSHERRLLVTVTPNGALQGGSQKTSLVLGGVVPEAPVGQGGSFTQNPTNPHEFGILFTSDPGAFFTIETSTALTSWSDVSSAKAEDGLTTLLTERNPTEPRRFWRVRRGQ